MSFVKDLDTIKHARYGKDVRMAMSDALLEAYNHGQGGGGADFQGITYDEWKALPESKYIDGIGYMVAGFDPMNSYNMPYKDTTVGDELDKNIDEINNINSSVRTVVNSRRETSAVIMKGQSYNDLVTLQAGTYIFTVHYYATMATIICYGNDKNNRFGDASNQGGTYLFKIDEPTTIQMYVNVDDGGKDKDYYYHRLTVDYIKLA